MNTIQYCPSTLAEGNDTYSRKALRELFEGRKVSHRLSFTFSEIKQAHQDGRTRLSLSGVQTKYGLVLDTTGKKPCLRLSHEGEQSQYILKPPLTDLRFSYIQDSPANEHLTMQIIKQVYAKSGLEVAESALIFLDTPSGLVPAYLTKRFDIGRQGKIAQEDFATLLGYSQQTVGKDFKYKSSYEAIAGKMKEIMPAYPLEVQKFFRVVLLNYLFCNGDAHLKNFSVSQRPSGDYALSPCYDMMNTRLHIPYDSAMALDLFADGSFTEKYDELGFYSYQDFFEFGVKIGILSNQVQSIIAEFATEKPLVYTLISHSYLSEAGKEKYLRLYEDRRKALNIGRPI
ncbi:MAG: type II toxin-antitoxin system HipA family toxin [Bacteroidetes bacterium]|nr:MAG: type II toxin-antitoxin system HipA family toxin [Bacteroidota bacterium]